jgi:DNA-binding PadR family transcriptional regulator
MELAGYIYRRYSLPTMARFDPTPYLPLTPAMFQVLVALADGEKHGYAVIKEVARRTDGKVQLRAGTLYTVIRRFVDDGLIQESDVRPDPALDDERRRYYRLTDRGRAVAVAEARRMADALAQARAKLGTI